MSRAITLAELSEETGVPARTIRFYIARGLLDGPVKAGRGAVYTTDHLARIESILGLQTQGLSLAEIARHVHGGATEAPVQEPTLWLQHGIADDVMVWVRGEVSPWRMKQIRAAIHEMQLRLNAQEKEV